LAVLITAIVGFFLRRRRKRKKRSAVAAAAAATAATIKTYHEKLELYAGPADPNIAGSVISKHE